MKLKNSVFLFGAFAFIAAPSIIYSQNTRYTVNPYVPGGTSHPEGYNNQYGNSENSQKLYDSQGSFRGNLNSNQYDPDSVSNPYGRYGSQYSPDSIKNPYGAGSQYDKDSPYNPYGEGTAIQN